MTVDPTARYRPELVSTRRAYIDESAIEIPVGGYNSVVYVIAAAVVVVNHGDLRDALLNRLDRKRPFHWLTDHGPVVRRHVIELLIERHVRAHVAVHPACARKNKNPHEDGCQPS